MTCIIMGKYYIKNGVNVQKIEYFNVRLLLGVLRSKQVSGRWWHHSIYSGNERGSFTLSTGQGTVLPPEAVMPQVTLHLHEALTVSFINTMCIFNSHYIPETLSLLIICSILILLCIKWL